MGFRTLELCLKGIQSKGGKCENNQEDFNVGDMWPISAFLKGDFAETLTQVLSLQSTIKSYLCHALTQFVATSRAVSPPCLVAGDAPTCTWLSSFAGPETACWAAPPGPAQVEQDCTWGYTLSAALSVPGTLSLSSEAKGNTGTCWEGCLNDQKHVAVRVMLKKLKCEIIIDQYLLKVWTTELKPH